MRSVGDHINELPDDILVNILSRLTMKEAVRTSIISSRWRYLWRGFSGCLNFDDPFTMANSKWPHLNLKSGPINVERHKFVSWVNQVLSSLEGHCTEGLRICFDVFSNHDIDNWIKFALERRVRRLELDFSRVVYNLRFVGQYTFPSHLDFYSSFRHLTDLSLTTVGITGEVLEHLLCYCCPVLEVLNVAESSSLTSLKVSGPSLKLKHLKLNTLDNLKDLQLHAPNLLSFEYSGPILPFSFRNVPNLVDASFWGCFSAYIAKNLCQHSIFLVQLRTLKLDTCHLLIGDSEYRAGRYLHDIPEMCNLKHLEIIGTPEVNDLIFCIALLKAAPSLYKFSLKLVSQYDYESYESVKTIKDHPYLSFTELRSIRVVELLGFVGHTADFELVMYLIFSAKLLEKIIIDPCPTWRVGTPAELIWRETAEYQSARRRAFELASKFPLWEFVIP
ncbi:hypothetical protein AB3S75_024600 [Citrus x aurantiifolia]